MTSYKLDPIRRRFASVYKNLMRRCYPYNSQENKDLSRMCSRRGFPHRRFNLGLQDLNNPKKGGMVDEWIHLRNNFINWCQTQNPPAGYCLERIDQNKPYGPDNCQFIPSEEKYKNLSNNHWVEYKGERMTFSELIKRYSVVSRAAVLERLKRGLTLEEALTTPSRKKNSNYMEKQKINQAKREAARKTEVEYRHKLQALTESLYFVCQKFYRLDRKWKLVVTRAKKGEPATRQSIIEECEQAFLETEPIDLKIESLLDELGEIIQGCPQLSVTSAFTSLVNVPLPLMKRRDQLLACIENTKNNEEAMVRFKINLRKWAVAVPTYAW